MAKTKTKPVHEIRMGRVRAAIWESETEYGVRHNVAFTSLYRNSEGEWQDAGYFGRDELPLVKKLADRAHDWVYQRMAELRSTEQADRKAAPADRNRVGSVEETDEIPY